MWWQHNNNMIILIPLLSLPCFIISASKSIPDNLDRRHWSDWNYISYVPSFRSPLYEFHSESAPRNNVVVPSLHSSWSSKWWPSLSIRTPCCSSGRIRRTCKGIIRFLFFRLWQAALVVVGPAAAIHAIHPPPPLLPSGPYSVLRPELQHIQFDGVSRPSVPEIHIVDNWYR